MADNEILIKVAVEGNADEAFKKISSSIKDFGRATDENLKKATGAMEVFKGVLGVEVVKKGFELLSSAIENVSEFLRGAVEKAIESENAITSLNIALKNSGQFSSESSSGLREYAKGIQETTKFSADAVLSSLSLLSAITKLDSEGLKKAQTSAIDLATALDVSLETATVAVGKAFEGGSVNIKKFKIEADNTKTGSENLAIAIKKINDQFGGSAASSVLTYSGATTQLGNTYNDLLSTIGKVITQNPVLITTIKFVALKIEELTGFVNNNSQAFTNLISEGIIFLSEALKGVVTAIQLTSVAFLRMEVDIIRIVSAFKLVANIIPDTLSAIEKLDFSSVFKSLEPGKKKIEELKNQISTVGVASDPFQVVIKSLDDLIAKQQAAAANRIEIAGSDDALAAEQEIKRKEVAAQKAIDDEADATRREELRTREGDKLVDQFQRESDQLRALDETRNNTQIFGNNATIQAMLQAKIAGNDAEIQALVNANKVSAQKIKEINNKAELEEIARKKRILQATIDSLNTISTLQQAKSKELQIIGKAAAIAQATINGFQAVTAALTIPPPLGFILAGLVATASAVQVAKIAGVELATGLSEVPPGFNNDTFSAKLSSGERVVSAPQNQDLKTFLNDSNGLGEKLDRLIALQSRPAMTSVSIGGKELMNIIQDQIDSGRSLSL